MSQYFSDVDRPPSLDQEAEMASIMSYADWEKGRGAWAGKPPESERYRQTAENSLVPTVSEFVLEGTVQVVPTSISE